MLFHLIADFNFSGGEKSSFGVLYLGMCPGTLNF